MDYTDTSLDDLLSSLNQYDEDVGYALDLIFVPNLNIKSMHEFYSGLINGHFNDIRVYLDDIRRNLVHLPVGYTVDAYATTLCIIYHLIQTDAIQNGMVPEEISYVEYDFARKTLENMAYLIRYLSDWWDSKLNDDELKQDVVAVLKVLLQYNFNLMEILSYCQPYATYDENYRNIAIMASDGWAAEDSA